MFKNRTRWCIRVQQVIASLRTRCFVHLSGNNDVLKLISEAVTLGTIETT